jgi:hypothetical protein
MWRQAGYAAASLLGGLAAVFAVFGAQRKGLR